MVVKTRSPMIPHFLCLLFILTETPHSRNDIYFLRQRDLYLDSGRERGWDMQQSSAGQDSTQGPLHFKFNSVLSQRKIGPNRKRIYLVMTGETCCVCSYSFVEGASATCQFPFRDQ